MWDTYTMRNPQRFIKRIVAVSVLIILLAPFVLTRPSIEIMSFLNTGQIGDTIGGISSPVVGIVSIFLLAYTLIEQLNFNTKQVQLQREEQFKATFFQLLQEQREITNSLFTTYEGINMKNSSQTQKIRVRGQEFFRMGTFVLKNLFDSMEYGHYCHAYDSDEIDEQLAYLDSCSENYFEDEKGNLHFFDFDTIKTQSKFCFLNDKYKITNEEFNAYKNLNTQQKIDFVYKRFFNVHEECGNYFRHLYRIFVYVYQAEEEELNDTNAIVDRKKIIKKYFDLVQFVQAQMSTKEMLMVFYNSFSFPKLRDMLVKYNILENLTVENLIDASHNCVEDYHLKHQK